MGKKLIQSTLFLFFAFVFMSNTIDLSNLLNYANQSVPSFITKDNTPIDNPTTDAGATLGRVLFYDKKLSSNNTISCASCHQQQFAFSDTAVVSQGVNGVTPRHSMRLVNIRFADDTLFRWDKTASSLEEQMILPIKNFDEMGYSGTSGAPDFNDLINELNTTPYYTPLFNAAFGDSNITEERIGKALAQFVRSIQSFDSKYDIGRAQVSDDLTNFPNFTNAENIGKQLFIENFAWELDSVTVMDVPGDPGGTFPVAKRTSGGFNCATCHRPPEFDIDPESLNNGFVRPASNFPGDPSWLDGTRSPTLRDLISDDQVTLNGGMFHSGQAVFLQDIFGHYNFRRLDTIDNPNLDPRLTRINPGSGEKIAIHLNSTPMERQRINAFLSTLTGTDVYINEKWSDPFDTNGNLTIISNCLTDQNLNNANIGNGVFEVSNDITSEGGVLNGNITTFSAGNSIALLPNFIAESGSDFLAKIDGCNSTSAKNTNKTPVSNKDELSLEVQIYPNPSSGCFVLKTNQKLLSVQIFTIEGKLLQSFESVESSLRINDLIRGNYIIQVIDEQQNLHSKKVVVF